MDAYQKTAHFEPFARQYRFEPPGWTLHCKHGIKKVEMWTCEGMLTKNGSLRAVSSQNFNKATTVDLTCIWRTIRQYGSEPPGSKMRLQWEKKTSEMCENVNSCNLDHLELSFFGLTKQPLWILPEPPESKMRLQCKEKTSEMCENVKSCNIDHLELSFLPKNGSLRAVDIWYMIYDVCM